jgi:hypothetical protein
LLSECRYTRRIWHLAAEWIGYPELNPNRWIPSDSTLSWWLNISTIAAVPKKVVRSLTMLISWEVWKERNNRVFNRKETPPTRLMEKIKAEAAFWAAAGAKNLASVIP